MKKPLFQKPLGHWIVPSMYIVIIIAAFVIVHELIPDQNKPEAPPEPAGSQEIPPIESPLDLLRVLVTAINMDLSPDTSTPPPRTSPAAITATSPSQTTSPTFAVILDNPTFTRPPTATPPATGTASFTPTSSHTPSPTFTATPTSTATLSATPTNTFTSTPSHTPTASDTPTLPSCPVSHKKACNDECDNDADGLIDMKDQDCRNPADDDESQ